MTYDLVRETEKKHVIVITDTHVIHDASATGDNVFQCLFDTGTDLSCCKRIIMTYKFLDLPEVPEDLIFMLKKFYCINKCSKKTTQYMNVKMNLEILGLEYEKFRYIIKRYKR